MTQNACALRFRLSLMDMRWGGVMIKKTVPIVISRDIEWVLKSENLHVEEVNKIISNTITASNARAELNVHHATLAMSICAMRGRDKTNQSHRGKANENYEQRLEVRGDGMTNTITTVQKDNLVLIKQATKEGFIPCIIGGVADLSYPTSKTRRGRVINEGMTSPTIMTGSIPDRLDPFEWEIDGTVYSIRIRKLTPKECWRLMGFSDDDFEKAESVNSNTQLYKQAGNSIVKNVLVAIFGQMIEGKEDCYKDDGK